MTENTKNELTPSAGKDCCCSSRKGSLIHKILGLKGISIIYKALAVLILLFLLYSLIMMWIEVFSNPDISKKAALLTSIGYAVSYAFYAFAFYSVGVLFKTLKKIKYAVEHK